MSKPAQTALRLVLARWLMRACLALMPKAQAPWAQAMAAELDEIRAAGAACSFAFGCLALALKLRLLSNWQSAAASAKRMTGAFVYRGLSGRLLKPMHTHMHEASVARIGAASACLAVLVGGVFMATTGAPKAWPWMNGLSLAFALASLALLPKQGLQTDQRLRDRLCLLLGSLLLASCALEAREGLNGRWLQLGPVSVQLVWLLVPSLLLLSNRPAGQAQASRHLGSGLGLLLAIAALWAQTEPMWLLLMGLMLLLRSARRSEPQAAHQANALLACLALLAAGLSSQHWQMPSSQAFVDQVLLQAWSHSPQPLLTGLMLAALLLLVLPGWRHRHAREHSLLWAGLLLMSLPGLLPTPLLGMGGSAILGYVLSLAAVSGPEPGPQAPSKAAHTPRHRREPHQAPWRRLKPR
ncbi:hypothetical protein [Roseateles sp.]|uniref:hypothetical protein n=1 Tax=Roseateles sp. TaxID=1971397 RepID=UPI003D104765